MGRAKPTLPKARGSVRFCGQPDCGYPHVYRDGDVKVCRGPRLRELPGRVLADLRLWWSL